MASSLTRTSSPIQISSSVSEVAANSFTATEIELSLNSLDQEVFVVTQINLDPDIPDPLVTTGAAQVNLSLSTTRRASVGGMGNSNVVGSARNEVLCNLLASQQPTPAISVVGFSREDPLFTDPEGGYIAIIATSNAYLNIEGVNNSNPKAGQCRIYGYRAKATAAVYAALVQSELLSA